MISMTLAEVAAAVDGRLVGADPGVRVTGPVATATGASAR